MAQRAETIYDLLIARAAATPAAMFQSRKDGGAWRATSWADGLAEIRGIARSLAAAGVEPGGKVAILAATCDRWVPTDLAALCTGIVVVPIYQSSLPAEIQYILENSEASLLFVENTDQLAKVRNIRGQIPGVKRVVVFYGGADSDDGWVLTWASFLKAGAGQPETLFDERGGKIKSDALATLVYTSGTTGPPKGTMLTHGNFAAVTDGVSQTLRLRVTDTVLLYLPLAHIFARIIEIGAVRDGYGIYICEGLDKIMDNLAEVKPTFFPSVPRIFEKAYAKILAQIESGSPAKQKIFGWALRVGKAVGQLRQQRRAIPLALKLQHRLADKLVYSKIKDRFGGRIRFFISGGAPLSKEIAEFFLAMDMVVLEGYGMTETTAVTNVNRPEHFKLGTVGPTLVGVEQKIAEDGEILSRGPGIMVGYYKREAETQEALTPDGWLHTGDIGEFDADGFLRITDRKKDLIKTSGGKYVAPQNLENLLKTAAPISQVCVFGDKRKFVTALITLDPEATAAFAAQNSLLPAEQQQAFAAAAAVIANPAAPADARRQAVATRDEALKLLVEKPEIQAWVQAAVTEKNKQLASYEQIKRFRILATDFSIDGGELTPTLKVKRKVVADRYKSVIDSMYDENPA